MAGQVTIGSLKSNVEWGSDHPFSVENARKLFEKVFAKITMITGIDIIPPVALAAADGAIALKNGVVNITKGSAAILTIAAPVAVTDDYKRLTIFSSTAFAHTVTNAAPGFNNGGAGADVATFGAAVGNNIELMAFNGRWHVLSVVGVALA